MATRKKIALRLIVILAIVFAVLLLVAPVFLNIDRYRPRIISYFEESTGKKSRNRALGADPGSAASHSHQWLRSEKSSPISAKLRCESPASRRHSRSAGAF